MGHREVRRVPLDFNWPQGEVWEGYLMPDKFGEDPCEACCYDRAPSVMDGLFPQPRSGTGYAPHANYLHNLWYGNGQWDPGRGYLPFHPLRYGSQVLTPVTPAVREFAERNVSRDPGFYGSGEAAIVREATRLASLWNGQWCHHLNQDDVNALVAGDRLWDFTHTWTRGEGWQEKSPPVIPAAAEVNEWSLRSMGHDSINAGICVRARCEREGFEVECPACHGHGSLERYPGQRAEAEAWEPAAPPAGEGWQLWETTTEGSPESPVFATAEELAGWCEGNATVFADMRWTREEWLRSFQGGDTSGDSLMVVDASGVHTLGPQ